jgi:hypothetical protein
MPLDFRRAYRRIERFLGALANECERSHDAEGKLFLEKAQAAFARADPDVLTSDDVINLDHALSYGHHALNALLRQYRMPVHDPADFQAFYDVVDIPFREDL